MINNEDNTISLIGDDGKSIKYDIVLTFQANENNQLYIVYTDNTQDEDGFIKTYAGIYHEEYGKKSLLPVETDEEWELIDRLLKKLEEKNKGAVNED